MSDQWADACVTLNEAVNRAIDEAAQVMSGREVAKELKRIASEFEDDD